MKKLLPLLIAAGLAACDQTPDQVYTPATLSGKAYVLADADHIAVVELTTTKLSRIKMDKKGLALALVNQQLFVLGADGTLATLQGEDTLTPWQEGLSGAIAMSPGPGNSLLLLGQSELRSFTPGQGLGPPLPLTGHYSSLFMGANDTVWLVDGKQASATPLTLSTKALGTPIPAVGNSIHHGRAMTAANELWFAEGNEYLNGEPYGIGYAKRGAAMPGGINVVDLASGKQSDFLLVGGNVIDLSLHPEQDKAYAASSLMPESNEATLTVINTKTRRPAAELRLCEACHQTQNITLKDGQGRVLSLAVQ